MSNVTVQHVSNNMQISTDQQKNTNYYTRPNLPTVTVLALCFNLLTMLVLLPLYKLILCSITHSRRGSCCTMISNYSTTVSSFCTQAWQTKNLEERSFYFSSLLIECMLSFGTPASLPPPRPAATAATMMVVVTKNLSRRISHT